MNRDREAEGKRQDAERREGAQRQSEGRVRA